MTSLAPLPPLGTLRARYAAGTLTIPGVAARAWALSARHDQAEAWIHRVPEDQLLSRARGLQALLEAHPDALERWPLLGIPFAVKDNIHVAGTFTTAGCPAYARFPNASATAVQRLLDAGALFVGKTNLDQFATGLVGTRSPYGACRNPFDPAYITGGSSSGSALAVSTGSVCFALGTDTAGSGRVPAAFTNIVGLKPTRGLVSTRGVVPACPSLDCVSVFALAAADAFAVLRAIEGFDRDDPYSRVAAAPPAPGRAGFRFGVPLPGQLDFEGDADYARLYENACAAAVSLGGVAVPVDIEPLLAAARLLYQGPWLAERAEAISRGMPLDSEDLLPLLREILAPAAAVTGADVFRGQNEMKVLTRAAEPLWKSVDALLLPTTPTIFTRAQIDAQPIARNAVLGRFTNFVNLMDLSAVAMPAGFRGDGLPFGVTWLAPAFAEATLEALALRWEARQALPLGATGQPAEAPAPASPPLAPEPARTPMLVFGLHLSGQPLNGELTALGARFEGEARTAPSYRMALLRRGEKRLPGIWRQAEGFGVALEGEIWSLPEDQVGAFFARVPAPLCLGSLELADGTWVKGFLAEASACERADDISDFGGWRKWLGSKN
jgi:allophanate hydrolase